MTEQQTPLTQQQLDDIEARANAATDGPWGVYTFGGDSLIEIAADLEDTGCGYSARRTIARFDEEPLDNDPAHREWTAEEDWAQVQADAEFVAHAPEDVHALLAEVARLKQQRKFLIAQLAKRDAESGRGDAALREFLAADEEATPSGSAPTPLTDARHPDDSREPLLWNDSAGNLLAIYPGCTDDEDRPTVALEVREPVFNGFFRVAQAEVPRLAADLCAAAGFRTVSERLLADAATPAVSGAADSRPA